MKCDSWKLSKSISLAIGGSAAVISVVADADVATSGTVNPGNFYWTAELWTNSGNPSYDIGDHHDRMGQRGQIEGYWGGNLASFPQEIVLISEYGSTPLLLPYGDYCGEGQEEFVDVEGEGAVGYHTAPNGFVSISWGGYPREVDTGNIWTGCSS